MAILQGGENCSAQMAQQAKLSMTKGPSPSTESQQCVYPSRVSKWIPLCRLPLRISERRLLLGFVDLVALNSALLFVLRLRMGKPFSIEVILAHPAWFALLTTIWILCRSGEG